MYKRKLSWGEVISTMLIVLVLAGPAAQAQSERYSYRLGPGDSIAIAVYDEPDLSIGFRIDDTGKLNYPFLGELQVEGLTVAELEQAISTGLRGPYLIDPEVTVTIKEYRPFYVQGEVQSPGGIPYQPALTVRRAVTLAGGLTERASAKKIKVVRSTDPEQISRSIKLNDPVYPGDVITVGESFF